MVCASPLVTKQRELGTWGRRGRKVFRLLVELEDTGMPATQARATIRDQFGLTRYELEDLIEQGIERQWPPLVQDGEAGDAAGN